MKQLLLVMNPYAGLRRANRYLADIIGLFNRYGWETIVHMTGGRGDGTEITARRAKDMDMVVAVGGDGTFNEVISGLLRSGASTPVGYIPAGSTNDFANSLHLPTGILEAAQAIMDGEPTPYDVGQFQNNRYFSYVASFGAFTRASYETPQNVKNALGHLAYLLEGAREISNIKAEHLKIETDEQIFEDDYIFGAISNSTSVGGILTLDPKVVDMGDGKFELLLVRAPRDIMELGDCVQSLLAQRYNCSMLTFCPTSHVWIDAPQDMPWTLDGERADGAARIEAKNLHHAIRLIQRPGK